MIFLGLEDPDASTLDDAYSSWTEVNVPPPVTLIVGQIEKMQVFAEALGASEGRLSGLDRLYKHSKVVLCGFDYSGKVWEVVKGKGNRSDLTPVFYDAVNDFVAQQIQETDIVIPAPPGIYFDKLSSRFASHFIRAEALLQSTTFIELLALRLLKPLHDWSERTSVRMSGTVDIYIDTMSIWPVGEKLRELHKIGNPDDFQYRIESFKSYDGLATWKPRGRRAFVIISATTSGGLAERMRTKLDAVSSEIWTLLVLAQDQKRSVHEHEHAKSIFELPRKLTGRPTLDGLRDDFQSDMASIPPGTETITIVGERFLSQPAKPKRVRLVHKAISEDAKRALADIAKAKAVKVGRIRFNGQSRWSISFDFTKLIDLACSPQEVGEDSLLKSWLRNYGSLSPVAIIYPSAQGSAGLEVARAAVDLAQRTEEVLRELDPTSKIFQLSSDELAKAEKSTPCEIKDCSIIIVAPVLGNGFIFKQISALLRHYQPKGPRLFLALAVLPESQDHLNQLKNDISGTWDDRRYDFKFHHAFPIGRLDNAIQWKVETEVLDELEKLMVEKRVKAPAISKRIQQLREQSTLDAEFAFLPDAAQNPLYLSTGFFLWPGSVRMEGGDYGGAVLLSIAMLLQAVRTSASKADATSLRTGLFQHALICPESFTRFNDASIQAALLRAAYPAELNYAVSPEISYDMQRLLLKWLQYYDQPAGAAAGEFLLAIAVGKMRLRKEHLSEILDCAKEIPGWIGCLATIAQKRVLGP